MSEDYIASGRKRQKQKTRDSILNSAKKFLTKGDDFTIEDIAEDISISRATVYRYFSNVEVLAKEAGLELNMESPESIVESLEHLPIPEKFVAIQAYFNQLTLANEAAFRRYLSLVITASPKPTTRGARRMKTLRRALASQGLNLSEKEEEQLIVVATALMGIEPLIVTKDVCGLSDQQSTEALAWGLDMMLKGIAADNKPVPPGK